MILGWGTASASAALSVTDADGVRRRLDEPGRVTVVIYSNPAMQEWTRKAGASLDVFQGRPDFRSVVLVDLRKSMADWAKGYTVRRMQKDLDMEALRIAPAYRANGNHNNPRPDVSAVADFKGEVCQAVGWDEPADKKRVVVFGKDGKVAFRSESASDFEGLVKAAGRALEANP
ncbi:MAG: hypothetical protein SFU85_12140 [Candidatus Methylacidiphilales bacterium]|nr:hypothetical protein [Candidatus Methylacidiphilales bacterium]